MPPKVPSGPAASSAKANNYKNIPYDPHIDPIWLNQQKKIFRGIDLNKKWINSQYKKKSIIYQSTNLITGKIYIGSAWDGPSYWIPSVLDRKFPIYNNILYYNHNNMALAILEDLGRSGDVPKEDILRREQYYLDLLFNNYPDFVINLSRQAGSTKGYIHKPEFGQNRTGELNPMYGRTKSQEFIFMQTRDKTGSNNPAYGKKKSNFTRAKLIKLVYVYNSEDMSLIGEYSTVDCSKEFKMGKDTLTRYIKNGLAYQGKIFSRKKLDDIEKKMPL